MAFANSILDATKDALVVTALGGAEQIPFLTVWAVLPFSIVFVVAFSWASVRVSRGAHAACPTRGCLPVLSF